ncbi:MAG: DUF4197 domain-containing protein [Candidatus Omnitrophica bacterium]|nr:DUF4197 domain-containing protein [Candidatus Omnitrophota bacterium]
MSFGRRPLKGLSVLLAAFVASSPALHAGIFDGLPKFSITKKFTDSDERAAQKLKEILRAGMLQAADMNGRKNGYLKNKSIRIALPEKIRRFESVLRKAGLGASLDDLILSMNRAAEQASPEALPMFLERLEPMTFEDARKTLKNKGPSASELFRARFRDELIEIYRPVLTRTLASYDGARRYRAVVQHYRELPVASLYELPAIEDYVTIQALEGLFHSLAEREKVLRHEMQTSKSAESEEKTLTDALQHA